MPYSHPAEILPDLIAKQYTEQQTAIENLSIDDLFYLVREQGSGLREHHLEQQVDRTLWKKVFDRPLPESYLQAQISDENKILLFKLLGKTNWSWHDVQSAMRALISCLGKSKVNEILRANPSLTEKIFQNCYLSDTLLEVMTPMTLDRLHDKKWQRELDEKSYAQVQTTLQCYSYPAGDVEKFLKLTDEMVQLDAPDELKAWINVCRRALFGLYDTDKTKERDEVLLRYMHILLRFFAQTKDETLWSQVVNLFDAISDVHAVWPSFEKYVLPQLKSDLASEKKHDVDFDFHHQFGLLRPKLIACLNDAVALDAKGVKSALLDRVMAYSCEMLPNVKPDVGKFVALQIVLREESQQQKQRGSYCLRLWQTMRSDGYAEWVDKMVKVMDAIRPVVMATAGFGPNT